MTNLLKETLKNIETSNHNISDIIFIGSEKSGYSCSWEEFEKLANKEYDSGYGAAEVAQDLIIVFSDGYKLYRGEYDGSEWWNHSRPFVMPEIKKSITYLFAFESDNAGWIDLDEIN